MADANLQLELAGARLQLLPERAVWWPAQRALLAADVHLGKGAEFRRQGMAVPAGSSNSDFDRLTALVDRYRADQLWILGDLFHSRPNAELVEAFIDWRRRLPVSRLLLVEGNHDRHVTAGADWQMDSIDAIEVEGIQLQHEPQRDSGQAEISGHIHPSCRIRSGRADSLRAPVFWLRGKRLVLPAFGSFTGGYNISPRQGERVFAVGPASVVELTMNGGR